jgi:hypothetical protein
MVEIKGERVLAASTIRKPAAGMEVTTNNEARAARKMVIEMLVAKAEEGGARSAVRFWRWADARTCRRVGSRRGARRATTACRRPTSRTRPWP